MSDLVRTGAKFVVVIHAAHRNGICVKCDARMELKEVEIREGKLAKRVVCPECGCREGQLISKPFSIEVPRPPQCISFKCVGRFILDSLFVTYLTSYHARRVAYAEAHRPEKGHMILERYRTGDPSPQNLWQAIHANLKLRCPICRKSNSDPFLFSNKQI